VNSSLTEIAIQMCQFGHTIQLIKFLREYPCQGLLAIQDAYGQQCMRNAPAQAIILPTEMQIMRAICHSPHSGLAVTSV
jgi:hypothetical protein